MTPVCLVQYDPEGVFRVSKLRGCKFNSVLML